MDAKNSKENIVREDFIEILKRLREKKRNEKDLCQLTSKPVWESFITFKVVKSEDVKSFTDYQAAVVAYILKCLREQPIETLEALASEYGSCTIYESFRNVFICNIQTQEYFFYINTLRNAINVTSSAMSVSA